MTRAEAEEKIMRHLMAIRRIVLEYAPDDDYLTMALQTPGYKHISFNNSYWEHEETWEHKINKWHEVRR